MKRVESRKVPERPVAPCIDKAVLERIYLTYNKRSYVSPDPLQFLYDYPDPADMEIVGLVAAAFAYGHVRQIIKTVGAVLNTMAAPREYLRGNSEQAIRKDFGGFKYRFTTAEELTQFLVGIANVLRRHGSLKACFLRYYHESHENTAPALTGFVNEIRADFGPGSCSLTPDPGRGSACKRFHLYLRWMVRRDEVDPGCWDGVSTTKLIVPMDVHMSRIGLGLGLTMRKQANFKAACEITRSFAELDPADPVRYDFALTRFGIRDDMDMCELFRAFTGKGSDSNALFGRWNGNQLD